LGCKVYRIAAQKGAIGMAKKGRGIFLAYTDIDPKYEEEFNAWFGSFQTKIIIRCNDNSTERKRHAPTVPHRA
jgi:hypothetical protein